jgi:MraZ protein
MVKFIGEYTVKLDDKGRLVVPSPFKSLLSESGDSRFVVKRHLFENCLEMYTYEEWTRASEQLKARLNFFNREHDAFWREYMRGRAEVEPDEKLGRISIPKHLLDEISVGKEVVFAGNDHKIEIWAKESFLQKKMDSDDFTALAEKILG